MWGEGDPLKVLSIVGYLKVLQAFYIKMYSKNEYKIINNDEYKIIKNDLIINEKLFFKFEI